MLSLGLLLMMIGVLRAGVVPLWMPVLTIVGAARVRLRRRWHPGASERLGYPTQKPEALINKIIQASTDKGDTVLDPFCGCGTAIVSAQKLQRQWIGIGISPTAVGLMERRVKKAGATRVKLVGMPVTEEQPRALRPFEFQNWVIQRLNGTHSPRKSGDVGIDGYTFFFHDPIQVKQSERVGRNVVDNFETAIERNRSTAGTVVAFSFTRGAYEETARAKAAKGLDITLTTVQQLLTSDLADPVTPYQPALVASDAQLPLPKGRSVTRARSVSCQRSGRPERLPARAQKCRRREWGRAT